MCVNSRQAKDILVEHNSNKDLNSSQGLGGVMCRFVKFNGAVSGDQLTWLDSVLQQSDEDQETVLVAGLVHCYCIALNYYEANRCINSLHCMLVT